AVPAAVVVEDDRPGSGVGEDRVDDVRYPGARPVARVDRPVERAHAAVGTGGEDGGGPAAAGRAEEPGPRYPRREDRVGGLTELRGDLRWGQLRHRDRVGLRVVG